MIDTLTSPQLKKIPVISHGFTTRKGGVSTGHFDSLNATLEKGDSRESVMENRRRIAEHLEGNFENLVTLRQCSSNKVIVIDKPQTQVTREEGDAIITKVPGLIIGIVTADCAPILLVDPKSRMIAAVHAGWQGAVSGIIPNTIKKMIELGAHPAHMVAAIGPCIWQPSYEVAQEFYDNFSFEKKYLMEGKAGHWQFDLPKFVYDLLKKEGVTTISPSPADTYTNEDRFFSYRRKTHRNESSFGCSLSAIMLKS